MKKFLALFLALIMVLSLTACGGDDNKPEPVPSASATAAATAAAAPTAKPAETGEPAAPAGNAEASMVTLETNVWTLNYDENIWSYDEDDNFNSKESFAWVEISIADPDDASKTVVDVSIEAYLEDAEDFRGYLDSYGFDARTYADGGYDFTEVCGLDMLYSEGTYWGSPCKRYFNRFEGAGATVLIMITGKLDDARVDELLSGLEFKLPDVGNVDFPWPWDGAPFSAEDRSVFVGTTSLNAKWLPIEECIITKETFDHAAAVVGDDVYLLVDGVLKQYAFDGASLTYVQDITLPDEYGIIRAANDGTLWLSEFMNDLIGIKDGAQTAAYDGPDYFAMSDDGTWGVSYFTAPDDCQIYSFAGGAMSVSPIVFSEVKLVNDIFIEGDKIFVAGSSVATSEHNVFIYNKDGVLQQTLKDGDGSGLGSVTFITETANGYLALDGNMREVVLWAKDGTFIGNADDGDLFGTNYPWFCGGTKLDDGSILVIMTEDRDDKSAMELVAYQLTGF